MTCLGHGTLHTDGFGRFCAAVSLPPCIGFPDADTGQSTTSAFTIDTPYVWNTLQQHPSRSTCIPAITLECPGLRLLDDVTTSVTHGAVAAIVRPRLSFAGVEFLSSGRILVETSTCLAEEYVCVISHDLQTLQYIQ